MRGLRVGPRTFHRTLRIQYLMWLYKCTSCPCIRAGFAFIAPEPISSATVIQIVIQKFFSVLDRFLKIRNFSPKIVRVIQTVIHIVIHDFRHLEKFKKFSKSITQIATDRISKLQEVSNSEFLIAVSCKTVIHIVIQKSCQNTKKPQ